MYIYKNCKKLSLIYTPTTPPLYFIILATPLNVNKYLLTQKKLKIYSFVKLFKNNYKEIVKKDKYYTEQFKYCFL